MSQTDQTAGPQRATRTAALLAVLLLAIALRFTALSWGLRHTPSSDEQDFVENAALMLSNHDWNHRFYEYPGLFLQLLKGILAVAPSSSPYLIPWEDPPRWTECGPHGYLAARALVAAFGVGSVGLAYVLGCRTGGFRAGLTAAILLAVSPVEVFVAHEVRPDVVLEAFVLMAFIAYERLDGSLRSDFWAGLSTGAAIATKFTGVLIVPSYLISRAASPGRRVRGALFAGIVALVVWVVSTPYSLLAPRDSLAGALYQLAWHYRYESPETPIVGPALFYLRTMAWSLGPVASVAALVGLAIILRRSPRRWAPILLYPVILVGVLSTAHAYYHRLVVSTLGVAAVVAASGFAASNQRAPRATWLLVGAGALFPLQASSEYLRSIGRPGAWDRASDWIYEHVPPGSRILTSIHELGLDRRRFEVIDAGRGESLNRYLARDVDLVVCNPRDAALVEGLEWVWHEGAPVGGGRFGETPEMSLGGLSRPVDLFRRAAAKAAYRRASLDGARVTVSSGPSLATAGIDDRLDTRWRTEGYQTRGDSYQVVLPAPVKLGRVELLLGSRPRYWSEYGRRLHLDLSEDGVHWRPVHWASGSPPVEEQIWRRSATIRQVLVIEPVSVVGVRIRQLASCANPWGFAELHLDEEAAEATLPDGLGRSGSDRACDLLKGCDTPR